MEIEKCRAPNGLVLVTFLQPWEAYRAGNVAGFADHIASAFVNTVPPMAQYKEYEAPKPGFTVPPIIGFQPHPASIRPSHQPDSENTALTRAPGGTRMPAARTFASPEEELAAIEERGRVMAARHAELTEQLRAKGEFGRDAGDGNGDQDPSKVEIPADWMDLHHMRKISLARDLGASETMNTKDEAEAFIKAEVDRRAAAEAANANQ